MSIVNLLEFKAAIEHHFEAIYRLYRGAPGSDRFEEHITLQLNLLLGADARQGDANFEQGQNVQILQKAIWKDQIEEVEINPDVPYKLVTSRPAPFMLLNPSVSSKQAFRR